MRRLTDHQEWIFTATLRTAAELIVLLLGMLMAYGAVNDEPGRGAVQVTEVRR